MPYLLESSVREKEDFARDLFPSAMEDLWPPNATGQFSRGPIPGIASMSAVVDKRPSFAVWTLRQDNLDLPPNWVPKNELATPPALLHRFPPEMVSPFVVAFNATEFSVRKGQWAVMLRNGGFLVLHLQPTDRPHDPAELPRGALTGLTRKEADSTVHLANELILRTARVPRLWHVVLVDPEAT